MLQLKELLKTLGWTVYESSAYCAIVENGPSKANDLAIKADIPPGRVYDVITNLLNKGWLKKTGNRPAIYDAQNPRLVLQMELDKLQKKMAESLTDAEQAWELRTGRIGDADDKSWTVSGIHGTIIEIRNLIADAKSSIKISDSTFSWLSGRDFHKLEELMRKGVQVFIVSTNASLDELKRLGNAGARAYVTNKQHPSFYVIDNAIVLMKMVGPDNGTVVRDTTLAKMFDDKHNEIIKNAKLVEVDEVVS